MSVSLELAYICCETADVSETQDRSHKMYKYASHVDTMCC